jgi:hypothetical protein
MKTDWKKLFYKSPCKKELVIKGAKATLYIDNLPVEYQNKIIDIRGHALTKEDVEKAAEDLKNWNKRF